MLNHLQGSSPEFEASAKPVESERRRSPRAVLQQLAYIRLEPDSGAIVLNVSEDGLAFHAVAPVHQSGTIRFSFSVKGNGQIQAVGELAWTDESRKTGGIKFTYLPDAAREQIRKWAAQSGLPQKPPTRIDKAAAAPVTAARELPAPPRAEPIARPEPA